MRTFRPLLSVNVRKETPASDTRLKLFGAPSLAKSVLNNKNESLNRLYLIWLFVDMETKLQDHFLVACLACYGFFLV